MSHCEPTRQQLGRYLEGELEPKEALSVGRHLQTCSNCKIRLHRERHLKTVLDSQIDDPITVDDDFCHRVMAELPAGPPPRRRKHLLRLAGWTLPLAIVTLLQQVPTFGVGTAPVQDAGRSLYSEGGAEILTAMILGLGHWLATIGTDIGTLFNSTARPHHAFAVTYGTLAGWALFASLIVSGLAWGASRRVPGR